MTPPRPLAGIKVVSLALQYPGNYATLMLSDLGADVVAVERPGTGDPARGFPAFYRSVARGKRSLALDLKDPRGVETLLAVARRSDVLLEGFRPGTMAKLGLDPAALRAVNPALVYVSISGFGQDGPYRDRPGHDLNYAALTGVLAETTAEGGTPFPPPLALGDLTAGLLAVQSVLLGLFTRPVTGHGGHYDVSMFDGLVSLLTAHLGPVLNDSGPPGVPYEPGYGVFGTRDGRLLTLGVAHENHFWQALCDVLDLPAERNLTSEDRFAAHERLSGLLRERIATRDHLDWVDALAARDIPHGVVNDLRAAAQDRQLRARGLVVSVPGENPEWHVRQPLVIDGEAPGPTAQAPELGAHTREVLRESGLADEQVQELVDCGVAAE